MKIKDNNDPYFQQIAEYIYQQFPAVAHPNINELLDILTTVLVGTKEIRYGSMPSPESLVIIRQTIRESIENENAIPILVPWGSLKAVNFSDELDIAEVMAIQRLIQTNECVKKFFAPGLDIVIRVEDISGYELFAVDMDKEIVVDKVTRYSANFATLVSILSDDTIRVIKESEMTNAERFTNLQNNYLPYFEQYLKDSENMIIYSPKSVTLLDSFKELQKTGWKGIISHEQRSFYYDSYNRNYSDQSLNTKRLALYMAQALSRVILKMSGKQDYWKSFIQITFVQPVKGLPEGYHSNCLYYRTIPMSEGRTHICPWRAKGYLKINSGVSAKITSANDPIEVQSCNVTLYNSKKHVGVVVRYILDDN